MAPLSPVTKSKCSDECTRFSMWFYSGGRGFVWAHNHLVARVCLYIDRFGSLNQALSNYIAEKVVYQVRTVFLGHLFPLLLTVRADAALHFVEIEPSVARFFAAQITSGRRIGDFCSSTRLRFPGTNPVALTAVVLHLSTVVFLRLNECFTSMR
jgi:hypothetical protein